MTRDDLKGIIPEITDEQLKSILDINTADIGSFKKTAETIKKELSEAKKTIETLEASKGDTEMLQNELQRYKDAEKARTEAEQKAAAEKLISDRFDVAVGQGKFVNDFTRSGILAEFRDAIALDDNKGKSDKEVYDSIVKDREGIFKNPNEIIMGGTGNTESDKISGVEAAFLAKNPGLKI